MRRVENYRPPPIGRLDDLERRVELVRRLAHGRDGLVAMRHGQGGIATLSQGPSIVPRDLSNIAFL
jgi:hypothetical protein